MAFTLNDGESRLVLARLKEISGIIAAPPVEVVTDTTQFTRIYRGQVIRLDGRNFWVRGDMYEPRFGMQDQPKFWVKRCYDLETGRLVITKLSYKEEFIKTLGTVDVPCYRSPRKEADVLDLVRGDLRFMQGESLLDEVGNLVRVIDFIHGKTLYAQVFDLTIDHDEYYYTDLPHILRKVADCCRAIQMLHDHDLYHGDIRNDHIIVDDKNGEYRWIDFDLCQDFIGFDLWRLGNVLQYVIGKGLNPISGIRKSEGFAPDTVVSLSYEDCGAYYTYRVMNLRKIYPYISLKLNKILMRFSAGTVTRYENLAQMVNELDEAIPTLPKDPLQQPLA